VGADRLRVEGLGKSFGGLTALADVSFEFPESGIVAIIGPNGAGKTTLLNVITGFMKPDRGRVFLGMMDITEHAPHAIAQLGVVRTFQDLRLIYRVPVLENLLLASAHGRLERLWVSLFRVGLKVEERKQTERCIDLLRAVKLEAVAHELTDTLSYGQLKVLSLAVCLATGARVLLLDEPVSGVDLTSMAQILELLNRLRDRDRLIVFIEHDMSAVRSLADLVVVMDDGRIVATGPPAEVLARPEILEAYIA
jgi:ABC-type branched-subunit amino acid transport system ATPase component